MWAKKKADDAATAKLAAEAERSGRSVATDFNPDEINYGQGAGTSAASAG